MNIENFEERMSAIRAVYGKRLFFVSGAPKSGTTWLQKILNSHPEILCIGEGHFMDCFGYFLHQTIGIYNTQQQLVAEHVYNNTPYYRQVSVNDFGFLFQMFVGMMLSQHEIPAHIRCIGDKTPIHALHLPALRRFLPEAKFLHIVRDGRNVAVSTAFHQARLMPKEELPSFTKNTQAVAERWVKFNQAAFDFGDQHPDAFHWLRYCDLISDFEDTLRKILLFLDVDASPAAIQHCKEANDFKTLTGRERGEEDLNSFYRKGMMGDWRNHFSPEHEEIFESIAGDMLRSLKFSTAE